MISNEPSQDVGPDEAGAGAGAIGPELPATFSLTQSEAAGVRIVAVVGELDLLTAHVLNDALAAARGAVVVDLCDCTFMDSAGLHALVKGQREIGASGGRLVLACTPSGPTGRVLGLAAQNRLETFESRSAALAALARA